MDRRRAGILAALLFLASVLTIEAVGADSTTGPSVAAASTDPGSATTNRDVTYYGDGIVYVGNRWKIFCLGLTSDDEVEWTRDGQSLQAEIDSHELHFTRQKLGSELSADAAKKEHSGTYKCMKLATEGHEIRVQDANSGTQPAAALPPTTLTVAETPLVATPNNYSWVIGPQGLTLTCGDSAPANPIWRRNGTEIVQTNKDEFRVENSTLFLRKASPLTYGNYSCYANDKSTVALVNYTVVAEPHTKLPRHSSVVEGEKLHLTCATDPSLAPEIIWVFGNSSYTTSSGRVTVTNDDQGVKSATLTIDNMEREDAGNVSCLVNYTKLKDFRGEAVTYLRVKDKLAALWPFLGICAEVVILCAIILVYEKKRNKAELDESDTDQSPDTKPTPNKDSEVRQRK